MIACVSSRFEGIGFDDDLLFERLVPEIMQCRTIFMLRQTAKVSQLHSSDRDELLR